MLFLQSPDKATGLDKIPPKLVKLWAKVINAHLTYIFNRDLSLNVFFNSTKFASIRPIFKKKDGTNVDSYWQVSILNCFWKICRRFLYNQLTVYVYDISSDFMAACRKGYSTSHLLIKINENWTKALDNSLLTGAVLMDLSKVYPSQSLNCQTSHFCLNVWRSDVHLFRLKRKETKCEKQQHLQHLAIYFQV